MGVEGRRRGFLIGGHDVVALLLRLLDLGIRLHLGFRLRLLLIGVLTLLRTWRDRLERRKRLGVVREEARKGAKSGDGL